jgi:hypothetical protein
VILFSSARGARVVIIETNRKKHCMSFIMRKRILLQVNTEVMWTLHGGFITKEVDLRTMNADSVARSSGVGYQTHAAKRLGRGGVSDRRLSRDLCVSHGASVKFVTNLERYTTIVHSRRQESHRKQMHVMRVPLQGCTKSECRLTCIRMQWVHWSNCSLCPLLAVSCGDAGLALFTLTVSSPQMDYSLYVLHECRL